jgi:radical SAM protein with 4Fe4S-binding SPASM domain
MRANLDSLKWSCNSADENQFKFVMNVSPKLFHLSLDNIRKAWEIRQEKGYKTKLYASSIKYDDAQIDKMSGFLDRYVKPYVDRHYWLPLYTMGGVTMKNEDGKVNQPVAGNPGSIEQPVAPIPCWTLFSGHILVDGRMTACCMDGMGKWVVGDLKEKSFMECWHSEKFQSLRRAHLAGDIRGTECENCALVGYGANNG